MRALSLTALLVLLAISDARAAMLCGERAVIVGRLLEHQEMLRSVALTRQGTVIEIAVSPTGEWSMLETYPNHKTCMIAFGEAWETLPIIAGDPA